MNTLDAKVKINTVFAKLTMSIYKSKRYGLKDCNSAKYELDKVIMLKDLLDYTSTFDTELLSDNLYKARVTDEVMINSLASVNYLSEARTDALKVCNIISLVEKINSL